MAYVVLDTDVCSFLFRRDERAERYRSHLLILPYDNETARAWARIRAERKPTPIAPQDAWIAACAIRHKCPLITHNASDYADISGLVILTMPEA